MQLFLQRNSAYLTHVLLFGDVFFDKNTNTLILEATMYYLAITKRFDELIVNNSYTK